MDTLSTCSTLTPEKTLRQTETTRPPSAVPPVESNPHWADFKSAVSSADWAMGASDECSAWLLKPSPGVRNGWSARAVC